MAYGKENPFHARIKEKVNLCSPGSSKETHHIVLDLAGSGFTYEVGDCLAVLPSHAPDLVKKTLEALKLQAEEKLVTGSGEELTLGHYLASRANLSELNKKVVELLAQRQTHPGKQAELNRLLEPDNRAALKEYLDGRPLWDLLHCHSEAAITAQEVSQLLKPLLPRFYSIASSSAVVGDEVHLTVRKQQYESKGDKRHGVCSRYLCELAAVGEPTVPVYIHPHRGFTLPEDPATAIIMIGPGTGVAPFRGFMQERLASGAAGKHWLFFGDWNRSDHFLYGDYWLALESHGHLRLDLAFSRDQPDKHYVQHRMMENSADLYRWIEEGAILYVCGDAERMAKDVEQALLEIIAKEGGKSDLEAKEQLRQLRRDKRYLRDVY